MGRILLTCHGYTGYPAEMVPLGRYFEKRGYSWHNLQLPGHGTTPEELKETTWQMWTDYIAKEVESALEQEDEVVFAGLSLGGAMTLYALEQFPRLRAGIALAPPMYILRGWHKILGVLPFINFWITKTEEDARDIVDPVDEEHLSYMRHHTTSVRQVDQFVTHVRNNLDQISQPLMIIHGIQDNVIPVASAEQILSRVSSQQTRKLLVYGGHVLTRERSREDWFQQAYEFVEGLD